MWKEGSPWLPVAICWLMLMPGSVLLSEARALGLNAGNVALVQQDRAAVQDTVSPVRFDVDVAAGNSRIQDAGEGATQFVTFGFMPEFYYGRLGVGLLLRLHVQTENGKMREEDFDALRDYLALLYFVEYGEEGDPGGYGRFGSIEDVTLGYGLFVDRYTNEISIDNPMRGLTGALATDHLRLEGMYSDFADPGVFGMHATYFPVDIEAASSVPRLAFGVGMAAELTGRRTLINPTTPGTPFLLDAPAAGGSEFPVARGVDDGSLYMVGVDVGVHWIRTGRASLLTFAEAAKILDYGVGATLGVRGRSELGALHLGAQYAQRFLGAEFLPDYFGPTYEAERVRQIALPVDGSEETHEAIDTRRNQLAGRQSAALGYEVEVEADYADAFESTIGYATIQGESGHARFHLDMQLHTSVVPVSVRIGYDRFNMEAFEDVFTRSKDDALYRVGLAYQVLAPLRIGVDVRQTYEPIYREGRAVGRTKQNRIEPYVRLVWRF